MRQDLIQTCHPEVLDHLVRPGTIEVVIRDRGDGITTNIARAPLYADMLRAFQFDDLERWKWYRARSKGRFKLCDNFSYPKTWE